MKLFTKNKNSNTYPARPVLKAAQRIKRPYSAVLEKVVYSLWIQGLVRTWRTVGKNIEIEFTKFETPRGSASLSIKKVSIQLNCEGIRALNRPGLLRAFVSTDQGILTKDECVQRSIGGRVLFLITQRT